MASPLSEPLGSQCVTEQLHPAAPRYFRSSSLVSREVAGETIVVPICRGVGDLDSVYTFNGVGRSLWQLLENAHSIRELAGWLATNYQVEPQQALVDVESYLAELQEVGLIQTA